MMKKIIGFYIWIHASSFISWPNLSYNAPSILFYTLWSIVREVTRKKREEFAKLHKITIWSLNIFSQLCGSRVTKTTSFFIATLTECSGVEYVAIKSIVLWCINM